MMGEISIPPHVIEAALNHANVHTDLATTYNRARYTQEVASALQALADRIDKIVSP
jgi:ribosome maturation protein Sdo1